jgi:hypothetical protein
MREKICRRYADLSLRFLNREFVAFENLENLRGKDALDGHNFY